MPMLICVMEIEKRIQFQRIKMKQYRIEQSNEFLRMCFIYNVLL
jgi:hypothetical protein